VAIYRSWATLRTSGAVFFVVTTGFEGSCKVLDESISGGGEVAMAAGGASC